MGVKNLVSKLRCGQTPKALVSSKFRSCYLVARQAPGSPQRLSAMHVFSIGPKTFWGWSLGIPLPGHPATTGHLRLGSVAFPGPQTLPICISHNVLPRTSFSTINVHLTFWWPLQWNSSLSYFLKTSHWHKQHWPMLKTLLLHPSWMSTLLSFPTASH